MKKIEIKEVIKTNDDGGNRIYAAAIDVDEKKFHMLMEDVDGQRYPSINNFRCFIRFLAEMADEKIIEEKKVDNEKDFHNQLYWTSSLW